MKTQTFFCTKYYRLERKKGEKVTNSYRVFS